MGIFLQSIDLYENLGCLIFVQQVFNDGDKRLFSCKVFMLKWLIISKKP